MTEKEEPHAILHREWKWRKVKKPESEGPEAAERPPVMSRGNVPGGGQGAKSPEAEGFFSESKV